MRAEKTFTGTGQSLDAPADGSRDATIDVSGSFVATVGFRVSRDGGASYTACPCVDASGVIVTQTTAAGRFYVLGKRPGDMLRATTTAYTSGSPKVLILTP